MYRLATMNNVTDTQCHRRHYDANSRSYCVQYERLIIIIIIIIIINSA